MYNFSGIIYRIWAVCGIIFVLGMFLFLMEKPWKNGLKAKDCKTAIIVMACAICMGLVYTSRIIWPDVSSYTGDFIESHRNSRVAPPLPFTIQYTFWNGEGLRKVFYLDISSKEEIFPYEFKEGKEYTIYFDEFTNVIVKVDVEE